MHIFTSSSIRFFRENEPQQSYIFYGQQIGRKTNILKLISKRFFASLYRIFVSIYWFTFISSAVVSWCARAHTHERADTTSHKVLHLTLPAIFYEVVDWSAATINLETVAEFTCCWHKLFAARLRKSFNFLTAPLYPLLLTRHQHIDFHFPAGTC